MLIPAVALRESKREARRQAMLTAAHDLFLEKGYEATTLSDVVGRSGGSLATLYELFENKPGLLRALVGERCSYIAEAIDRAVSSHTPLRDALREIADHMFDKIIDPGAVALLKSALAQPDLGPQLYRAGPATGQAKVAEYLALQSEEGVLEVDDPAWAAQLFFQMMFGQFHQKMIFGMAVELGAEEKERHFDRTLDAFLKIFGRRA